MISEKVCSYKKVSQKGGSFEPRNPPRGRARILKTWKIICQGQVVLKTYTWYCVFIKFKHRSFEIAAVRGNVEHVLRML